MLHSRFAPRLALPVFRINAAVDPLVSMPSGGSLEWNNYLGQSSDEHDGRCRELPDSRSSTAPRIRLLHPNLGVHDRRASDVHDDVDVGGELLERQRR